MNVPNSVVQAALKSTLFHFLVMILWTSALAGLYAAATLVLNAHGVIDWPATGNAFYIAFVMSIASSIQHFYNSAANGAQVVSLQERLNAIKPVPTVSSPLVAINTYPSTQITAGTTSGAPYEVTVNHPQQTTDKMPVLPTPEGESPIEHV